ncbi:MAG TPA: T9SS type B sorting domain-containing protein [Cyclobacteriaceae bacterium]|nr:T9SS type B sorting domain-containing protein [Cyclobacteriaceae bacterium]
MARLPLPSCGRLCALRRVAWHRSTYGSFHTATITAIIWIATLLPKADGYAQKNLPPEIVGQRYLVVSAGSPLKITFDDLEVIDPDDSYPEGFTLTVLEGGSGIVDLSGNVVVPNVNFGGNLEVPVIVNDGEDDSNQFNLVIGVTSANGSNGGGKGKGKGNENQGGNGGNGNQGGGNGNGNQGGGNGNQGGGNGTEGGGNGNQGGGNGNGSQGGGNGNQGGGNGGEGSGGGASNPRANIAPVITGQRDITTAMNVSIDIVLSMLKVTDPDNIYPDEFALTAFGGSNYSLDGNRLTPAKNFTGTLQVGVLVSDGIAKSNVFPLQIAVRAGNIPPQIIGQKVLTTPEDTGITIGFDDLTVFDPDSSYPEGFTLRLVDGNNFAVENRTITPDENFSGTLTVMATVNDGQLSSVPYALIINVLPSNDAPVIRNLEQNPLGYFANAGPAVVTQRIEVIDPDGENIAVAEISFDMESYLPGHDILAYDPSQFSELPIESVFDLETGTLFLIGSAPAAAFQKAIRAVTYSFTNEDMVDVNNATKTLYFSVRDGDVDSNTESRDIDFTGRIDLDVPHVFTPNGDMSNDTWSVTPLQNSDDYSGAVTRVYNIRGQLLYEASGFEWEWDGKYQGQYLPSDTYYYVISLNSGVRLSNYNGIVTILR